MGFFQNLKDDLSVTVNDIVVNELGEEKAAEPVEEVELDIDLVSDIISGVEENDEEIASADVDEEIEANVSSENLSSEDLSSEDISSENFDTQSLLDLLKSDEFKEIDVLDKTVDELMEEAVSGSDEVVNQAESEDDIQDMGHEEVTSPVRDALNSLKNASLRYEQQQMNAMLQDQIEDKIINETEKEIVAGENENLGDIDTDEIIAALDGLSGGSSDDTGDETSAQEVNDLNDSNNDVNNDTNNDSMIIDGMFLFVDDEIASKAGSEDVTAKSIEESSVEPSVEPSVEAEESEMMQEASFEPTTETDSETVEEVNGLVDEPVNDAINETIKEEVQVISAEEKVEDKVEYSPIIDDPYQGISDEVAIIAGGMVINGDISSDGNIELTGTVNGNIDIRGKLSVAGKVNGNIKANDIFVDAAELVGNIAVTDSVKVGDGSVIIGNIEATAAIIAGAVKGDIDVHGPVILDSSAIIMGNIKSMAVQINNGAVIEGMCSQCYADVNPTEFFNEFKKSSE